MPPRKLMTSMHNDLSSNFEFINYTGPPDTRNWKETQRAVRAHNARYQHANSNNVRPDFETQPWDGHLWSKATKIGHSKTSRHISHLAQPPTPRHQHQTISEVDRVDEESTDLCLSAHAYPTFPLVPVSRRQGSMQEDPFWTFAVERWPIFPRLIAHYIQTMALPIPELDGPDEKYLLRTQWFPDAMSFPATTYAILLMSAAHHLKHGTTSRCDGSVKSEHILMLKAKALEEVNRGLALHDNRGAVSDMMIAAVAKLAAFEAIFGEIHILRQHMLGLRRMLEVRQAVAAEIGPLSLFLRRLLVWIDLNAAHFAGTPRVLADENMQLNIDVAISQPDPIHFAGTLQLRHEALVYQTTVHVDSSEHVLEELG